MAHEEIVIAVLPAMLEKLPFDSVKTTFPGHDSRLVRESTDLGRRNARVSARNRALADNVAAARRRRTSCRRRRERHDEGIALIIVPDIEMHMDTLRQIRVTHHVQR